MRRQQVGGIALALIAALDLGGCFRTGYDERDTPDAASAADAADPADAPTDASPDGAAGPDAEVLALDAGPAIDAEAADAVSGASERDGGWDWPGCPPRCRVSP